MGSVNNKLRYYRRLKDLTQDELGAALEVTRQTILAIEKRKYEPTPGFKNCFVFWSTC